MRYTKKEGNQYSVSKDLVEEKDGNLYGEVIDLLGKLEDLIEGVKEKRDLWEKNLQEMREQGRIKTLRGRETLGMKMIVTNVITSLNEYGIEVPRDK